MKKEILEALTAKFPGVSASILGRIAATLAKTAKTAEQVKTAVEGVTLQQVIESYGDSRATEASETARENAINDYETRHGLKDGVKITTNTTGGGEQQPGNGSGEATTTTGGTDEMPKWMRPVLERLDRIESFRTTETRTQQLNAIIGKLPETIRKAYERIPLDKYSDADFAKLLGEITTEVEGIADDTAAQGAVFGTPPANTGGAQTKELSEAQIAAISRRDGSLAADGQPF